MHGHSLGLSEGIKAAQVSWQGVPAVRKETPTCACCFWRSCVLPSCFCCRAAQVNSLTSFETDIPFDYYSMPFCKPPEGVRRAGNAANLGTVIMGVKLENSQYNFTVMVRAARLCSSAASYCTIQQLCCSRQVRHLAVGVQVAATAF